MTILQLPVLSALLVACLLAAAAGAGMSGASGELLGNGDFSAGTPGQCPRGWRAWSPAWKPAACRLCKTPAGLLVDAPGRPFGVGGVEQDIRPLPEGGAVAVTASCRTAGMAWPLQSVLVRLTWMKGGRLLHPAGRLVRLKSDRPYLPPPRNAVEGGNESAAGAEGRTFDRELEFADAFAVPRGADGARLSLEVKWPSGGAVLWRRASVVPCAPPGPRKVRIGSVYLRPRNSTPAKNLALWCGKIDQAGRLKLDAVCLGEAITLVGTGRTVADVAEPIPGPATEVLAAAARRNRLWVVAGLTERDGRRCYNTAVLLDRSGRLAGKYRKVHLPREEWKQGVAPGGDYPVFQTDFGTVGMMICYDWFFPEAASILALNGAEVLFAPTWGNTKPDAAGRAEGQTVFRVRARDNALVLVPSVYDGSSMVIDPLGRILATSDGENEGIWWAEVDLNRRERLWWVGDWRAIGPRHRMPGTYGRLTERR